MHHYRFTLYQLPNDYQLPGGLAGAQAAQTITGAATAQAQLIGTFGGLIPATGRVVEHLIGRRYSRE